MKLRNISAILLELYKYIFRLNECNRIIWCINQNNALPDYRKKFFDSNFQSQLFKMLHTQNGSFIWIIASLKFIILKIRLKFKKTSQAGEIMIQW